MAQVPPVSIYINTFIRLQLLPLVRREAARLIIATRNSFTSICPLRIRNADWRKSSSTRVVMKHANN